jgi:hypothetical protein
VPLLPALKNLQDLQAGQRGLQTIVFQFVDLGHVKGCLGRKSSGAPCCRYNDLIISASPQP